MSNDFKDLVARVEAEAGAEGPEAVLELEAMRDRFALGRQVIQLRRRHDLTQKKLAELTGIGQSEISKIERGESNATTETLARLGAPFHVRLLLVDENLQVVGSEAA